MMRCSFVSMFFSRLISSGAGINDQAFILSADRRTDGSTESWTMVRGDRGRRGNTHLVHNVSIRRVTPEYYNSVG